MEDFYVNMEERCANITLKFTIGAKYNKFWPIVTEWDDKMYKFMINLLHTETFLQRLSGFMRDDEIIPNVRLDLLNTLDTKHECTRTKSRFVLCALG